MKFIKRFVEKDFAKSLSINIALAVVGGIVQSVSPMPLTLGMLVVGIVGIATTFMAALAYIADNTSTSRQNIIVEDYNEEVKQKQNETINETVKNSQKEMVKVKESEKEM